MSNQTHTPGPWKTCGDGSCSCKTVACADYPVAKITVGKWGDDYASIRLIGDSSLNKTAEAYMEQITYGEVSTETATANARLIAAAPDLLAELKQCALETEEAANLMLVDFPRTAKLLLKASERTLALIAKAEGR